MTYKDQLKDPRWQRKRLEILERDKWTCKLCGDKKTELHVHHYFYTKGRQAWEYENEAFDTYCRHCHFINTMFSSCPITAILAEKKVSVDKGTVLLATLFKHEDQILMLSLDEFDKDFNHKHLRMFEEEPFNELHALFNKARNTP